VQYLYIMHWTVCLYMPTWFISLCDVNIMFIK